MLLKNIKGGKSLLDVIHPQLGLTKRIGAGALLASVLLGGGAAQAQLQDITLTNSTPGVEQGTFSIASQYLYSLSQLSTPGSQVRNYVASYFTAGASRSYYFGQTSAPVDTVMFLVTGTFNPLSPGTNAQVLDDDTSVALHLSRAGATVVRCGQASNCPQISYTLTNGQRVTLVVTTFNAGASLGLPLTFYADGPGTFSASAPPSGPDASNTQTMVYLNAFDVNAALTHRTMVIAESLSYDCSIFDANNICVSWGGRYGTSGNSVSDGAGVLTVAYRFLPEFYVGAFVDQSAPLDYGTSIRSTGMDPTIGGFLVWQENPDQSGFRVRLSAARHNGNVRITREASLSDTEAGSGKTGLHSWGYGADISYGFNVDEDVLLSPYAGIRRSTARRQGYTEESWDSVEYPLSYRHMDRELTTATMGIRGTMRIDHGIKLMASAGMEYDVKTSQDALAGTSSITDFESFSLATPSSKANRTRGAGSVGAQIPITPSSAFVVNTSLRQQAYTSDLSLAAMASVVVGF